jgi:hypothetical protein
MDPLGSTQDLTAVPQALLDMEAQLRKRNAELEARRKDVESAAAVAWKTTQDRALSAGRIATAPVAVPRVESAAAPPPSDRSDDVAGFGVPSTGDSPDRAASGASLRSKIPRRKPSPAPSAASSRPSPFPLHFAVHTLCYNDVM